MVVPECCCAAAERSRLPRPCATRGGRSPAFGHCRLLPEPLLPRQVSDCPRNLEHHRAYLEKVLSNAVCAKSKVLDTCCPELSETQSSSAKSSFIKHFWDMLFPNNSAGLLEERQMLNTKPSLKKERFHRQFSSFSWCCKSKRINLMLHVIGCSEEWVTYRLANYWQDCLKRKTYSDHQQKFNYKTHSCDHLQ